MAKTNSFTLDLPIDLPDDVKQEVFAYFMKWLPVLARMAKDELQGLYDKLRKDDYRGAMKVLMDKMVTSGIDPYLEEIGADLRKEWADTADYNAELREALNDAATVALKIVGALLVAMI